ncbi:MAG: adenylate/guanylate cyclase domain-containing protein [Dongiaceae bacterium]
MTSESVRREARSQGGRKLGLKLVLACLILTAVGSTAVSIHLLWARIARDNVADVAGQLNAQIIGSIKTELLGVRDQAVKAQQAVASVFANGTIDPDDESKRDFMFLALLRAQPSVSWVSFGSPDGNFSGARKVSDELFDLVSVKWDPATSTGVQRIFHFRARGDELIYESDEMAATDFNAVQQEWYLRAVQEGAGWNRVTGLPDSMSAGISSSAPLTINTRFRGVINAFIEFERLSRFLQGVKVGENGTVVLLSRDGHIVASPDPAAIEQQQQGLMPSLEQLGANNRSLSLVDHTIKTMAVDLQRVSETQQLEVTEPDTGETYYVAFAALNFRGWTVATVIPVNDFLASIEDSLEDLIFILVGLTVLLAGIAVLVTNRLVAQPLTRIAGQLKHIENFRLDRVQRVVSRLTELDGLSQALVQMSRGLASFQKYMSTELVRTLVSQGIEAKPGGTQEVLTVSFSDLAGFTSLSERLGEGVVPVLTEFLESATAAVAVHHGEIDKFIGDAVMAFWGAPIANPNHARDACAAALECARRMAERRIKTGNGADEIVLQVRTGINTGRMLVGNIGSSERLSYTVIGDPVNIASRLEPLNKQYGTNIIIGQDTREAAGDAIITRMLDWVAVYGRVEGIGIHELLAMAGEGGDAALDWANEFEAGLEAYKSRRWSDAIRHFEATITARGGLDRPSELFIERSRALLANPPGADWSHLSVQMEK